MRLLCCSALTCLIAACAPPKAVEVVEQSAPKPRTNRPAVAEDAGAPRLQAVQKSGMVMPDLVGRLPEKKDLESTTEPPRLPVIANPPKPGDR